MIAVVDTSAVMRLFIPDGPIPRGLEAFMRGVECGANSAIAPELLLVEALNVVVKKQRRGELSADEAEGLVGLLQQLPIRYHGHLVLSQTSYRLAVENRLTGYDAVFLALALGRGVPLFTADERLQAITESMGLTPAT